MLRIIWVYLRAAWFVLMRLFVIRRKYKNPNQYTIEEKFSEIKRLNEIIIKSSGIDLRVEGKEHLNSQPVLYVANHASMFDPYLLGYSVGKQMGAVIAGDEWYQKIPVVSKWFELIGSVYVNRKNAREAIKAINQAANNAQNGHSILVFPEGEITQYVTEDCIGDFKGGSFKIATKAKVPIVPIALIGSEQVYRAHGVFGRLHKGRVIVKILKPYTKHLETKMKSTDIAEDIKELIKRELIDESHTTQEKHSYSNAA